MNLFHHFLHLLSDSSKKPAAPVRNEYEPNNCEYLLSNLQRICAMLPDGEASVVMGRNKLDICLTWDTAMQANANNIKKNKEFQFWLNGKSEVVEWAETPIKEEKAKTEPVVHKEVTVKETAKPTRQQLTMRRLLNFLQLHYAIRRLTKELGLNPRRYKLADGCGLSHYNYITPELLVAFLKYAYSRTDIFQRLYKALPVSGIDGTLKYRMGHGTPAFRQVHAKTGSYTGINCLAGYLKEKNGHWIAFAIMNQNVLSGRRAALSRTRYAWS